MTGTGGSNTGTGGSNTGSGGSNTGTGGSNTGSGGSNTGTGGSNTGTGGSNTGTGGSTPAPAARTTGLAEPRPCTPRSLGRRLWRLSARSRGAGCSTCSPSRNGARSGAPGRRKDLRVLQRHRERGGQLDAVRHVHSGGIGPRRHRLHRDHVDRALLRHHRHGSDHLREQLGFEVRADGLSASSGHHRGDQPDEGLRARRDARLQDGHQADDRGDHHFALVHYRTRSRGCARDRGFEREVPRHHADALRGGQPAVLHVARYVARLPADAAAADGSLGTTTGIPPRSTG